jgi:hypothetical protein
MMGFPPARTTKVRAGRVGDRQVVSPRTAALLDEEWQRQLAPPGLRSYDELRAALARG